MFPHTSYHITERVTFPAKPKRRPEAKPKPSCTKAICRAEFDARMAGISQLEGKAALKALLRLNRELLPHVSRAQELMWIELCGVWFKRVGG